MQPALRYIGSAGAGCRVAFTRASPASMNCIVLMARSAPKGRAMPAQGNALGFMAQNTSSPERARQRLCRPFRA